MFSEAVGDYSVGGAVSEAHSKGIGFSVARHPIIGDGVQEPGVQDFQKNNLEFSLQKVKNHNKRKSHSTNAGKGFCVLFLVVCGKRGGR